MCRHTGLRRDQGQYGAAGEPVALRENCGVGTCTGTADLYCMGSSGQVSVGHTELAAMDVLEDGRIDFAPSLMPDTCPGRRSGWSSRRPRCCGGRCVRPSVRHQSGSGERSEQDKSGPMRRRRPQVVTSTRAPRCQPSCAGVRDASGEALRRRAHALLLRADRVACCRASRSAYAVANWHGRLRNK